LEGLFGQEIAFRTLGYKGDLDARMPRHKREVLFSRGELTRAIVGCMRDADGAMTSQEVAQSIVALRGDDARDLRFVSDLTKRASKALRKLQDDRRVRSAVDGKGDMVSRLA
jgi:hypothetical protein